MWSGGHHSTSSEVMLRAVTGKGVHQTSLVSIDNDYEYDGDDDHHFKR